MHLVSLTVQQGNSVLMIIDPSKMSFTKLTDVIFNEVTKMSRKTVSFALE